MNKQITIFTTMLTFFATGLFVPVQAQWDLGGTVNPLASGGAGSLSGNHQPNTMNANGSPGQPYLNELNNPNALQPRQYETVYNQYGGIQTTNPFANIPANILLHSPGALSPTSSPQLSPMQNNGYYNNLPKNLPGVRNGLPPTRLDSFVREAGGAAARIYGDEGTYMWPPMNGFSEADTINAGIVGSNNQTLTTGHGSKLPTASGNGMTISGPRLPKTKR